MRKRIKYNLPKGYSVFGTAFKAKEYFKDPVSYISGNMRMYSGTYTTAIGVKRKIILTQDTNFINYILKENHKNYIKSELATKTTSQFLGNGLFVSNGEHWRRQRRLIQPAFHKDKITALSQIVINTIEDFIPTIPMGNKIDMYPLMNRVSFDIIINSIFDIHLQRETLEEISEIFRDIQDFVMKDINQPFRKLIYPFISEKRATQAKSKRLRQIFKEIITERRSSTEEYSDLLDMLLHTRYEDSELYMEEEQVIDEVIIIIFAGHETTANTLSWLLYLLSSNKQVYEKLKTSLSPCSIEESIRNEYLQAVISESMRLYPAAWISERAAIQDDAFGEFVYPKNTIIAPYFFGLHRDENLWENASEFIPERFVKDPKLVRSKIYFPFGAGPRMCIGNNFALMEMSFFLYSFLKNFEIAPTDHIPSMRPLITLRPDKVLVNVKRIVD